MKTKTKNNRQYLVSDVVMMVPGIRNGSDGPVFYPGDVLKANTEQWNGQPITVRHPRGPEGVYISAHTEGVAIVGHMEAVKYTKGALQGTAWVDVEALRRVDPDLLANLLNDKILEVSIGIYADTDGVPGEFAGRGFTGTLTGLTPDHLAILPDEVGACSVADGCGFRVNVLTVNSEPEEDDGERHLLPPDIFPDDAPAFDPFAPRPMIDEDEETN
jgi:hypothetical protein